MQLTLKYNIGEGEVIVKTNLYTTVLWERKFRTKASKVVDVGFGQEDLAYMCYEAARVAGHVIPGEFDTFLKRHVGEVEVIDQDDELPTKAAID